MRSFLAGVLLMLVLIVAAGTLLDASHHPSARQSPGNVHVAAEHERS